MGRPCIVSSAVFLSLIAGCAGQPRTVARATPEQKAALFDRVKSLQGTWEATDDKGQRVIASTFTVSSNGSIVREIMLPGSPHEMTNVYHMDGPTMVMTHYCAIGNQPRLRAEAPPMERVDRVSSSPTVIHLKFDSVTNLTHAGGLYMGDMVLTIIDPDHITEEWTDFKNGSRDATSTFHLTRKADRTG